MRLTAERGFPTGLVLAAGGLAACLAVGFLHLERLPVTLCTLKRVTGIPCPTCGSTRAFARLFHRDLMGAFLQNPLAALAALIVVLWGLSDLVLLARGRALGLELAPAEGRLLRIAALAAFLSNWVYVIAAGR